MDNVVSRIEAQVKGAYGTVDKKLVEDISNLEKDD